MVVYRTVIRPVLDYCAVVYHPMMNDEQDQAVEQMQAQALKCIYGYRDSYAVMREKAGVTTQGKADRALLHFRPGGFAESEVPVVVPAQDGPLRQAWRRVQGVPGQDRQTLQLPTLLLPPEAEWQARKNLWT